MSKIQYQDTDGVKSPLPKGTLGYDDYAAGGDEGRVAVGTQAGVDILLAKKSEVDTNTTDIGTLNTTVAGILDNTTAAEYGITDVYTKTEVDTNTYTQTQANTLLDAKLDDSQLIDDGTMATALSTNIASAASTKTYVDTEIANIPGGTTTAIKYSIALG